MKKPTNTTAKILHALINGESVNLYTFKGSSLRARIADLRNDYGLQIDSVMYETINEFGNPLRYATYILKHDKKAAKEIYNKINQKSR